jgi:hypothetical protein
MNVMEMGETSGSKKKRLSEMFIWPLKTEFLTGLL